MAPGSQPSKGIRGFFKGVTRRAKKVLDPEARATGTGTSLHLSEASLQTSSTRLTPTQERLQQPATQSQQSVVSLQPAPDASQPTPSVSTSALAGTQPANTGPGLSQAVKRAGADAWLGLKTTLQVLEKSDIFLPLKSAVAGFLEVVDMFEMAAQNRDDYAELASNLQGMVDEFREHPGEHTSSEMSEALQAMASGLQKEMEYVQEQRQRSGVGRHLGAAQGLDDVQGCYRRVETLCRELQNKALIKIWKILEEQQGILEEQKVIAETQRVIAEEQKVLAEEQQLDARLERLNAALKAMYDSKLSTVIGRRKCTPGTREAILTGMREWADNPDGPKVYWLNGMAGTGKTTLAYSFCAEMKAARRLGASFFCSRADADSRDVSRIVPTIAHQLARLLPAYREALIRQIGEDKDIGERTTEAQFEKLIRDPLREIGASVPAGIVVTIDALDECNERGGAQEVLNVLFSYVLDLPIKFLVTCRPEPGLFDEFYSRDERHRSVLHLHDIETSFVQADIRTYLEAELAKISLSQEELAQLTEQAGALFIYAATAVRYILPKGRQVDFRRRLRDVLSIASTASTDKHKHIDNLYTAVLAAPFADEDLNLREKENIRMVLDTAVCAREPMKVATMTKLLGLDDEQDIILALQHLRSVLHVSHSESLISTFHASFPDFMLSRERSGDICCKAVEHNRHLALRCFGTMKSLLRFNICDLESSFIFDENVPNLAQKINQGVSPELFYACRYWKDHLDPAEATDDVCIALREFLSSRLLFWMEVMNLRNCIGAGSQMLQRAHSWLRKSTKENDMLDLILDADRFVTAFGMSPASRSTPHIYISALAFWPETRPVRLQYGQHTQGLVRLEGQAMKRRDLSRLATWTTTTAILCVAFSPDGTRIVSSSYDNSIRVWDARSGLVVAGPFEGHTSPAKSVAFSPNGTLIISGSYDNTIRVWNARSGDVVAGPFQGHTGGVNSVAFSFDGSRIVSGSSDNTIRVWDARSGDVVVGPFIGHTDSVSSVAFSSDGTRVVSGSSDNTIRVWDARSGDGMAGPFKGHAGYVTSVAFSSDGTRIVSGSDDKTICVWDAHSGDVVAGPFEGHTDFVYSVAFSPDDTRIVSASGDKTIRVWDAHSGVAVAGPFEGHTHAVMSVAFSPDGTRIVSGSYDQTIRIWDARSGNVLAGPFKGHTGEVYSAAFSPDGTRIASGSGDKTIHVWDARSGDLVAGPFKGHTARVWSVGFSSDGSRIASGSGDKTIYVWDARSGDVVAGPFKGHTGDVYSVGFSPDDARIVSSSYDWTIRVWDARSGDVLGRPFEGRARYVLCVVFSPDGTRIASGSADCTIRVWDTSSGDVVAGPFEGHTGMVWSVGFSPDGTRIVSGSDDKTVRIWDTHSGAAVAGPFEGHTGAVLSVGFSPDGSRIVSGSVDKTVRIWDAHDGLIVARPLEGHTGSVWSVAFSSDGTRILSSSEDKTIRVWDASTLDMHRARPFGDWTMDEEGFVITPHQQLLLCVPTDLHIGLMRPQNTLCIYRKGSLSLDLDDVYMGQDWVNCYQCDLLLGCLVYKCQYYGLGDFGALCATRTVGLMPLHLKSSIPTFSLCLVTGKTSIANISSGRGYMFGPESIGDQPRCRTSDRVAKLVACAVSGSEAIGDHLADDGRFEEPTLVSTMSALSRSTAT